MIIVMHCGGMPFNGATLEKQSLGGSETAAYYVARELAKRGHRVTLFTNHPDEGAFDGVKYIWAGPVNERAPLGERFHFYASHTPHDVCLIQRMPGAFVHRFASKINVAWLHDLALYRQRGSIGAAIWNLDAVLTVSAWHKDQVCEVYGLEKTLVHAVTNGIDPALYEKDPPNIENFTYGKFNMLYSSRPERGLEHLLRPGGIMENLIQKAPSAHLYVCSYDNRPPQLEEFYAALDERADMLPNVTRLPSLTKEHLSQLQMSCDLHVYPTEFEEVSCITAMEAMAAGLPFLSSQVGALPETCRGSGSILIPLRDGAADEGAFVDQIEHLSKFATPQYRETLREDQRKAARRYTWERAAERFEVVFERVFADRARNPETVLRHLLHESDYYAAENYLAAHPDLNAPGGETAAEEMRVCYRFARERDWANHYEGYYEYEKNRGVDYGPESLDGNTRYHAIAAHLAGLPAGSRVLDYGCAHGHYTVNLAKAHPALRFVGVDITESNIEKARKWAADEKLDNVEFFVGAVRDGELQASHEGRLAAGHDSLDLAIVAEVLEHVEAPWEIVDTLGLYLKDSGKFVCSTPTGPWEAIGYKEHWPWRAHVHHFEREDLYEIFGHHPGFNVQVVAGGADKYGEVLGQYVFTFGNPSSPSRRPDYERKFKALNPRETLAVCVIARDAELSLGRCLDSVKDIADEIIVAVDNQTKDATREIAAKYVKGLSPRGRLLFDIQSPLESGFDEARNLCIERAQADWILWIDSDEVLYHPERLVKYLRRNQLNGYSVKQLHYAVEPAGVMKVDLPIRLFRNRAGIKFFGVVHEHPETEINKGVSPVMLIADVAIGHYGYTTEAVRRARFDRNIGLLVRDRQKYPTRWLGKFLWLRDLAQMNRWEAEQNGGVVTPIMRQRAHDGIKIWEELLDGGQIRILTDPDNLGFYSTLVETLGQGYQIGFKLDTSKLNGGARPENAPSVVAHFASRSHAEKLFLAMLKERTQTYESKYF